MMALGNFRSSHGRFEKPSYEGETHATERRASRSLVDYVEFAEE
jgi:hypothetical protein